MPEKNNILQKDRPIAFTDLETTGLDARRNEIIEIGLIVADPYTLTIRDEWETKVFPQHIETADATALAINGYKEIDWLGAMDSKTAINIYAKKIQGSIFCSHNPTFDWAFVEEAFLREGVAKTVAEINAIVDYHRLDIFSLAWGKLKDEDLPNFHLSSLARFLGVPQEATPHRAINGARLAYEIYKKIMTDPEKKPLRI